jgi:ABC-type polysaccharide/polyol phosphate transport system ATPase subunit/ABC-type polysaccharide/polyol phosphate export permease
VRFIEGETIGTTPPSSSGRTGRQAISVDRLNKSFRIPHRRPPARSLTGLRPRSHDVLRALRDVSFEVQSGEFFGIVGRNGGGKSTLLKCLAGIYDIESGSVAVNGRLSPFVELGVGFSPELSGRDNVIVNGVMMGLSRAEISERFDQIIAFSELAQFIDLPFKNYSSGMAVRLSFSVAIQLDADILLIDEVLAVGDAAFQRKCFDEFDRFKAEGRTIVFVTHDMRSVRRFCDRAMLLEQGQVLEAGEPGEVARQYEDLNLERTAVVIAPPAESAAPEPAAQARSKRREYRQYRPSAISGQLRQFLQMVWTLSLVDFKLRYHGSAFGYLWSIMRPVMLFGVTYFVFTRVAGFGRGVKDYGAYLLTAIVLWTFFSEATSGAPTGILQAQDLMRKLRFPRLVLPLAAVTKALINLAVNSIAVAVIVGASGIEPRLSWLELVPLLGVLVLLASGLSMLLAAVFVSWRDVAQIWSVVQQLLFFGSSVLYVVSKFPKGIQHAMVLNPLAMVFTQMRHALIDPQAPTAAAVAGGGVRLLLTAAIVAIVVAAGFWTFHRQSATMAENL